MRDMPNRVAPLERAIVNLLGCLPLRWERLDVDALTAAEQEALKRLARAGLVEQRIRLRAWMAGSCETLRMQVRVSGEYQSSDVIRRMFDATPEWLDGRGRTRGRFHLESGGVVEVRLTDQGEEARHDWQHNSPQTPSFVLAFVAGIGPMGLPRPRVEGSVVVESCRLEPSGAAEVQSETTGSETQPPPSGAGEAAGSGGVAPAFTSQATVGDVTVHNHFHLDQGAVVESVLKRLSEQQAAAETCLPEEALATARVAPAAPQAPGAKDVERSRAQWPVERTEAAVQDYLQSHKTAYRRLGQGCLDGRRGAAEEFRDLFGPTAIARVINDMLGITDPRARCRKQDVSRTPTYRARIRPLLASPPRRPEGWVAPDDGGSPAQDILDDIHGTQQS